MADKDKKITAKPVKKPKTDDKPVAEVKPVEEPKVEEPKTEEPDSGTVVPADDAAVPAGTDQHGRQLYNVKCADCGKQTQVPFKPTGDRPVYCRDCYMKKRKGGAGEGMGRGPRR